MAHLGMRPMLLLKPRATSILSTVDQLIPMLENINIPFIIVVEAEFEDVLHALKTSQPLQERVRLI